MAKLRLALAFHNHQPIGNFDGVIEDAYRDSYLPFLDVLEKYPEIRFSLHTSGSLLDWLVDHKPGYIDKLRSLVERGQVEILGGAFYEPILTMIPSRDRRGQIRGYSEHLHELFGCRIRGMWVAERVWEQNLVSDIAHAGIEYTILDDYHFRKAGLRPDQLFGYYTSEDEGRIIRIFPGSERMRYLLPFREMDQTLGYLRDIYNRQSDAIVVFADDGEKFGTWPETKAHVYEHGWIYRFLDGLKASSDWIDVCTLSQAMDDVDPTGQIYLPDCSYREMTEWALPADRLVVYERLWHELEHHHDGATLREFLKGGFWRNFKVRYPETNEMYSRMLQVSQRLERLVSEFPAALGDARLNQARAALYRGQCNCAYWHGAFGGLYLPHLRNAVFTHLIDAENKMLSFERKGVPAFVSVENKDLNNDGRPEIRLDNEHLAAFFDPAHGGRIYELDVRSVMINLGSSLTRRPEAYHEKIRHAGNQRNDFGSIHDRVVFKQEGLAEKLIYDSYPRKSLIDHFFAPGTDLHAVRENRAQELGDFVEGKYRATVSQTGDSILLSLSRKGKADGRELTVTKSITLAAGQKGLKIQYRLENLPEDRPTLFAVEWNFGALAARADDRYFYTEDHQRQGTLGSLLDLTAEGTIGLVDEWLGIDIAVSLSQSAGVWSFPIESVSQSEGGFEAVHQSVCLMPHWEIPPGIGTWEVELEVGLNSALAEARKLAAVT